jgi:leucyl-tRNA synthetase
LTNDLGQNQETLSEKTFHFGCQVVLQLLFPIVPHITSELWQRLGFDTELAMVEWPIADERCIVKMSVCYAVQVNGKVRAKIDVDPSLDQEQIIEQVICDNNVKKYLENREIRKTIVVPNKVISFVV